LNPSISDSVGAAGLEDGREEESRDGMLGGDEEERAELKIGSECV
jgi:hypothetical protein